MIDIRPIPAFDDNYIWLLSRPDRTACAVVDPGDEEPVIERLDAEGLVLAAILVTHKHGDHVGGIRALKQRWPDAVVYGPANEPIKTVEQRLRGGDRIALDALGIMFEVLDVPGHTEGHIAYYAAEGDGVLFCGDTLFAAGCGRVFSGTFEQLSDALVRLGALPPQTRAYCAHEYTEANARFAVTVEPRFCGLGGTGQRRTGRAPCARRGEPSARHTDRTVDDRRRARDQPVHAHRPSPGRCSRSGLGRSSAD